MDSVRVEIRARGLTEGSPASRALLSEMAFYGQSLMRLKILKEEELEIKKFEGLWTT
jgi:hypothetical protein